jgi:hypothetical protein
MFYMHTRRHTYITYMINKHFRQREESRKQIQDSQCTHSITLRHVHATIVAVENQ